MSKNIEKKGAELGDWIADQLQFDKLIKGVAGKAAEAVDNPVFRWTFAALFERVPQEHDERVSSVVDAIISGNAGALVDDSIEWLVTVINSPLGDEKERIIGRNLGNMVKELVSLEMQKSGSVGGGGQGGDPDDGN